ncbi:MAG: helix-turn-helix domain-containing protein [Micromonosporaceae bacterium]|nr:helix-turn-helix domain-containing protein [Micromonosporaceae bacterium]
MLRPRERLGRELRSLRVLAGLTGPQLAERMGVSQSRVSRTETAKYRIDLEVVRQWLTATGADEPTRQRILSLAEQAATEIAEYRSIFRGSLFNAQQARIQAEAAATRLRHFQPFQIPGPFQTPAYARVALQTGRVQDLAGLDEAIDARMRRGEQLRQPGAPDYHVVLTELALRYRPVGISDADRERAWRKLVDVAGWPAVTVQIIPADAPMRQAPMCAFLMTEFADPRESPIVQVELPAVEMTFSGADDLAAFEIAWQRLVDAALDPKASRQLITVLLHPGS